MAGTGDPAGSLKPPLQIYFVRHGETAWSARTTCDLAGLGAAAQVESDLAEWDYGDYEGLRSVDIRRQRPDWDVWRDGCPGGEMPAEVGVRADRVIARLRNLDGPVILFSHGQFGRVLATRWIGRPAVEGLHFALDPASIGIWPPWSSRWASR